MLDFILSSLHKAEFLSAPYKALVIDDFLPEQDYLQIEKTFPQHSPFIHAKILFEKPPAHWLTYLQTINSIDFYNALLKKFDVDLNLSEAQLGLRKKDFHTPYVSESYTVTRTESNIDPIINKFSDPQKMWMLPPHRDSEHTILSLVHYFPTANQQIENGSFFVVKPKANIRYFQANSTIPYGHPDDFEIIHEIPYKENRVVALLSGDLSWHAIGPCAFLRRSVNMSLEMQNDGKRTLC